MPMRVHADAQGESLCVQRVNSTTKERTVDLANSVHTGLNETPISLIRIDTAKAQYKHN